LKLGRAAAHVFKNLESQARGRGKHKIVIGKDTRLSGYMLENAISSGILSMAWTCCSSGRCRRGRGLRHASLRAGCRHRHHRLAQSLYRQRHQIFRADGYKLEDKIESEIERLVFTGDVEKIRPSAEHIARLCALMTRWAATSNLPNPRFRKA